MTQSGKDNKKGTPEPVSRLQRGHSDLGNVLIKDESVLLEAVIHKGIYWKAVVFAALAVILFMTPAFNLGILFIVVSAFAFAFAALTKYFLALVITDKRVLARWGILNLDFIDMRYSQIESAEVARSPLGRILGYGTVVLAGTGQRVVAVPYVANAGEFRRALNEILLKRDEKTG